MTHPDVNHPMDKQAQQALAEMARECRPGSPRLKALEHAIAMLESAGKPVAYIEAAPNASAAVLAEDPDMFPLLESTRIGFGRKATPTVPGNQWWPLYLGQRLPSGDQIQAAMVYVTAQLPDAVQGHGARMQWIGERFLAELGIHAAPQLPRRGPPTLSVVTNEAVPAVHPGPPDREATRLANASRLMMAGWLRAMGLDRSQVDADDEDGNAAAVAGVTAVLETVDAAVVRWGDACLSDTGLLDACSNAYTRAWEQHMDPNQQGFVTWDDDVRAAVRVGVADILNHYGELDGTVPE